MRKQSGIEDRYVLDTSAFFVLKEGEDGADIIQNLLEKARERDIVVFRSFVSYTEVLYITYREVGKEEAQRQLDLMHRLTVTRVDSSQEPGLIAERLKQLIEFPLPMHG